MKKLIVVVAVLTLPGMAMAAYPKFALPAEIPMVEGGSVTVPVTCATPGDVIGINLNMSVTAPLEITGMSFLGTAWVNINPPSIALDPPRNVFSSFTIVGGAGVTQHRNVGDIVGWVTVLAPMGSGIPSGTLATTIPDYMVTSDWGDGPFDPAENEAIQATGQITPEPVTAILLLAAVPFLRRRHA